MLTVVINRVDDLAQTPHCSPFSLQVNEDIT